MRLKNMTEEERRQWERGTRWGRLSCCGGVLVMRRLLV